MPRRVIGPPYASRSEEHTSELQSRSDLVCRLLLEKKNRTIQNLPSYTTRSIQTWQSLASAISATSRKPSSSSSEPSRMRITRNFFFFACYGAPRELHSFPTRRSSD